MFDPESLDRRIPDELRAAEEKREQRQKTRLGELRQRFIEGPVLVLPSAGGGTFDARGATLIPGSATVHFFELQRQGSLLYGHFDKVVPNRHRWVAPNVSALLR